MAESKYPRCARCPTMACVGRGRKASEGRPSFEKAPAFCPMKLMQGTVMEALPEYDKPDVKEFARMASIQEFECYERVPGGFRTKIPRIEELVQFSHKCGYRRLGIAHCAGLTNEARILTDILERKGFEVVSVQCKVGGISKESIGLTTETNIAGPESWESMCNPIAQAFILNNADIDLAVMLGLCLGHDTLFIKYCRVPITVLAVKDRVFGHNPLAALYLSGSIYYERLMAEAV